MRIKVQRLTSNYHRMTEKLAVKGKIDLTTFRGLPTSPMDKTITEEFLIAAEDVIEMMRVFGIWTKPITDDMKNNVNQVKNFFVQDKEERKYLEEMLLTEVAHIIRVHLLWLCRALEFCIRFLLYVAEENDIRSEQSNDIRPCIKRAYSDVLKPYHGFLLQRTFIVSGN